MSIKKLIICLLSLLLFVGGVISQTNIEESIVSGEIDITGHVVSFFVVPDSLTSGIDLDNTSSGLESLGLLASITPDYTSFVDSLLSSSGDLILSGLDTGNMVGSPRLIISEVFFDGTDEWIEISNVGSGDFTGDLTINGAKSNSISLINQYLPIGASKIFGDNMVQVLDRSIIFLSGLSFSISDTLDMNISLLQSGIILDSFEVKSSSVSSLPNNYGFEKICSGGQREISQSDISKIYNISGGWIANPGKIYSLPCEVTYNLENNTGSNSDPNGSQKQDICSQTLSGLVIQEIFAGNDRYPLYIEIEIQQNLTYDYIELSGSAIKSSRPVNIVVEPDFLQKNKIIVISNSGFREQEQFDSIWTNGWTLISTGDIFVYGISGQKRQVLDIVYLTGLIEGKSLYYLQSMSGCLRRFDIVNVLSPGFDKDKLNYIDIDFDTLTNVVYTGCSNNYVSPSSITNTQTKNEDAVSRRFEIIDIVYDPPGSDKGNEVISISVKNQDGTDVIGEIDMSKAYLLINGRKKSLTKWGKMALGQAMVLKGDFGFPNTSKNNQAINVVLMYQNEQVDTYSYTVQNEHSSSQTINEQDEINKSGTVLDDDISFKIISVDYDPPGADKERETIEIFVENDGLDQNFDLVDLSQDYYLLIGQTKKSLAKYARLSLGTNVLTGSFGFPNSKDTCVGLMKGQTQLDSYCYLINEKSDQSGESLDREQSLKITSLLPNPKGKDDKEIVKLSIYSGTEEISYEGNEIFFKDLYIKVANQKKHLYTGLWVGTGSLLFEGKFSLPNKAACIGLLLGSQLLDTFCYDKPHEDDSESISSDIRQNLSGDSMSLFNKSKLETIGDDVCITYQGHVFYCKKMPSSKTSIRLKKENALYTSYINSLENYLKKQRGIIYFNTDIKRYFDILHMVKKSVKQGIFMSDIGYQSVSVLDIDQLLVLYSKTSFVDYVSENIRNLFPMRLIEKYNEVKKGYFTAK